MIAKPFPDRAGLFLLFIQHFGNILSGFCHSKGTVLRIIMYNIKKVDLTVLFMARAVPFWKMTVTGGSPFPAAPAMLVIP